MSALRRGLRLEFDPYSIVKAAMKKGGEFADLFFEDLVSTSIVMEDDKVEKVISGRDMGCGIRVISNFKTYYAYTNDISQFGLMNAAQTVADAVKADSDTGRIIALLGKTISPSFGIKKPPIRVPLSEKIAMVKRGNESARAMDKRIRQVKVVYGDALRERAVINSDGEWAEEVNNSILYVCQAVAEADGIVQTGYEPIGGAIGFEVFDDTSPEEIAGTAVNRSLLMLDARKAPGGQMSVVLSSEAGGTMIHEAIGHGLEADLAGDGLSVYSGRMGEEVASPLITVIDDGTVPFKRGSSFFDGEGTPTKKNVLVEKGVLKAFMYDRLSAMKADEESTGNGRRESYRYRPIPRMTNTMIAPGESDPAEILSSVDKGLYVRKMGGGQVNTVTGDFVFEVSEGYLIEKGKQAEAVRGATLTGNGPEILKSIDMVGSDLGFGIGTCGKDGQGVPVADAQPTLRIPSIVVGGDTGDK
jgi:TldD protein